MARKPKRNKKTIELPAEMHQQVKILATQAGTTIQDVVEAAVKKVLPKKKEA